jgi:membrane-bound lytic murein transglycosylase A
LAKCDVQNADETMSFKIKAAGHLTTKLLTRKEYCHDTNSALLKMATTATSVSDLLTKARDQFDWYQSDCDDGSGNVWFTGYHGPILDARRTRQGPYQVPIFRTPDELKGIRTVDLQDKKTCESFLAKPEIVTKKDSPTIACMQDGNGTFTPPDRAAIMDGALRSRETGKKGLAIGYVTSDLEVYLLQVEGAGTLKFSDKDFVYVNTGGTMSFKKIMMGHVLRCRGVSPAEMGTADAQRKYFEAHPKELAPDLKIIRNYLFFDDTKKGLLGVDDIELSGASVAADPQVFPTGLPMISFFPSAAGGSSNSSLKVAQDKGSAINGGCHVDVFYGASAVAEKTAGDMTAHGSLFVALPKEIAASTSPSPNAPPALAPAPVTPIGPPTLPPVATAPAAAALTAPAAIAWPAAIAAPPSIAWPTAPTAAQIVPNPKPRPRSAD